MLYEFMVHRQKEKNDIIWYNTLSGGEHVKGVHSADLLNCFLTQEVKNSLFYLPTFLSISSVAYYYSQHSEF